MPEIASAPQYSDGDIIGFWYGTKPYTYAGGSFSLTPEHNCNFSSEETEGLVQPFGKWRIENDILIISTKQNYDGRDIRTISRPVTIEFRILSLTEGELRIMAAGSTDVQNAYVLHRKR